jgi:HEPN domain-containing protein
MTDFARIKMGFVVALLAVLFMLKPVIDGLAAEYPSSFVFLGVGVRVLDVYYVFTALLGLAAYFYAMEMVGRRSNPTVQALGNIAYALAILVPPFYLAMALIWWLTTLIANFTGELAGQILSIILAIGLVLGGGYFFATLRRTLRDQDKQSAVEQLSGEQAKLVAKANGLLEAGLHDLVLVESFRALETALKKRLVTSGVHTRKSSMTALMKAAEQHKLIGQAEREQLHDLRMMRNEVVHESKHLTRDEAEDVIDTTRRLITALDKSSKEKE